MTATSDGSSSTVQGLLASLRAAVGARSPEIAGKLAGVRQRDDPSAAFPFVPGSVRPPLTQTGTAPGPVHG